MATPERVPALTRRGFLTAAGATVVYLTGCRAVHGSGGVARTAGRYATSPWIAITTDNDVVVLVDKCEMGQGVRHMFASIVAEELGVRPEAVKVEDAPVDAARYGNRHIVPTIRGISLGALFPFQMTGRSSSVADMWDKDKLRGAAAGTRRLLVSRAAKRFDRPAAEIELEAGHAIVRGDPARIARFADLLGDGRADASPTTPSAKHSVLGNVAASRRRIDAPDKVTGRARFGIDVGADDLRRDGLPVSQLLVALVRRPSRLGDTIDLVNPAEIRGMPGVKHLVELSGGRGFAVVADSFWHADKARRAMQSRVPSRRDERAGSAAILVKYEQALDEAARRVSPTGDRDSATPDRPSWQTYVTPFGPHAAMEPLSAVCVRDEAGIHHIYAASQFPQSARAQAARVLGDVDVQIHGQLAGGAFGRRAASDFIVEVAEISRKIGGAAVQLMWTREDDFTHDHLRPCAASRVRATAVDHVITSWQHLLMSESPNLAMGEEYFAALSAGPVLRWLGARLRRPRRASLDFADITMEEEGLVDSVYDMRPAVDLLAVPKVEPPIHGTVRLGYVRSVGFFHTIFAVESMVDELAWATGSDPLEIRRRTLQRPHPHDLDVQERQRRMRWCVDTVAGLAGADHITRRGTGYGIACFSGWNSFAALVVRAEVDDQRPRQIRVREAWAAVDCGFVLNPDVLDQQVEGGIVFGLSAALKQEITTVDGMIRETNFHACDGLRIHECPAIRVVHREYGPEGPAPSGVGELMVPLPAPAVANAVFNLPEGRRLRRVPLTLDGRP